MLAITGVYDPRGDKESRSCDVRSMVSSLTYQGAFQESFFDLGPISLGVRRFNVAEKSDDVEAISNEDKSLWLVCNGQVYSSDAVRKRLEAKGHRFKTSRSDEIILHLYEIYGLEFFEYFDGMFAFVLYDVRRKMVIVARDRFGIKPMFYTVPNADGMFMFSSQLEPLAKRLHVSRTIDSTALHQFFSFSYILHPRTIYERIRRVSPSTYLKAEGAGLSIENYWELPTRLAPLGMEEGGPLLDTAISNAVRARLPIEGPLCAYLSGGVDSSTIAWHMTQQDSRTVQTFSARFPLVEDYDEGPMAQLTAEHLGTEHHEVWMEPKDVALLPELMGHFGEPFADPSQIPTFLVARRIRESSPVALCGDGADEILGGYELYEAAQFAQVARHVPDALRRLALTSISRVPVAFEAAHGLDTKLRRFLSASQLAPFEQHEMWKVYLTDGQINDFYTPEFLRTLNATCRSPLLEQWRELFDRADRDWLTPIQYVDIKTYLVDNNMTKVEGTTMANSLDVRVPYLDREVFETAFRLPAKARVHWGQRKVLAKRLMKGRLPEEILHGKKKGFGVPLAPWFLGPLEKFVEEALRPERLARTGVIRPEVGRELIAAHKTRRVNLCRKMWNLICFLAWYENNESIISR